MIATWGFVFSATAMDSSSKRLRKVYSLAAAAVDPGRNCERVAIPGGRHVGLADLLQRLEDAEVKVLAFRSPERHHRGERREARRRAFDLGDEHRHIAEALARPLLYAGGGGGSVLTLGEHEKLGSLWKKF